MLTMTILLGKLEAKEGLELCEVSHMKDGMDYPILSHRSVT